MFVAMVQIAAPPSCTQSVLFANASAAATDLATFRALAASVEDRLEEVCDGDALFSCVCRDDADGARQGWSFHLNDGGVEPCTAPPPSSPPRRTCASSRGRSAARAPRAGSDGAFRVAGPE